LLNYWFFVPSKQNCILLQHARTGRYFDSSPQLTIVSNDVKIFLTDLVKNNLNAARSRVQSSQVDGFKNLALTIREIFGPEQPKATAMLEFNLDVRVYLPTMSIDVARTEMIESSEGEVKAGGSGVPERAGPAEYQQPAGCVVS
jgi:predicted HTH transcriptional regulator